MTVARRTRISLIVAVLSLVAAIIGAIGPADAIRSTYTWPPRSVPATTPTGLWYTPLLLIRHQPESITARIPCSLPPSLRDAPEPTTVLATARTPETGVGSP